MQVMEQFDFDAMARLAKSDPEAFEARRREMLEALFARIGKRSRNTQTEARLRGLQFRVDMERRRAATPMQSLLRIYSMMWDSFIDLNHELQSVTSPASNAGKPVKISRPHPGPKQSAQIIGFPKRAD